MGAVLCTNYCYLFIIFSQLALPFCSTQRQTIFDELLAVGRDDMALAIMRAAQLTCADGVMAELGACAVKVRSRSSEISKFTDLQSNCLRAVPLLCAEFKARLSSVLVLLAAHRRMWPVIGRLVCVASADWSAEASARVDSRGLR